MLSFKKTMLAVLAVTSSAAFAGTMGPVCSPSAVTVPCETCAWDFGGHALYFLTSSSGYMAQATMTGTEGSFTKNLNPNWNWGFQLEGSYHFGKGKDINVNWSRLRGSNSRNFTGPQNIGFYIYPTSPSDVSSYGEAGNDTTINYLNQSRNFAWDMVNVEFAQHVDFDEHTWSRFHVGVDYSRVADNAFSSTSISWVPVTTGEIITNEADTNLNGSFNGFGPRVGTDLGYNTTCGLGIYGGGAIGLLTGTSKVSIGSKAGDSGPTFITYNVNRVVFEADARLGLKYDYQLVNGNLSLDAGWMWVNYLSPLSNFTDQSSGTIDHNFGTQGVYFGGKWLGNFA